MSARAASIDQSTGSTSPNAAGTASSAAGSGSPREPFGARQHGGEPVEIGGLERHERPHRFPRSQPFHCPVQQIETYIKFRRCGTSDDIALVGKDRHSDHRLVSPGEECRGFSFAKAAEIYAHTQSAFARPTSVADLTETVQRTKSNHPMVMQPI